MFASILKKSVTTVVLGAAVFANALTICAKPGQAQAYGPRQFPLSIQAKQALNGLATGLSPYEQRLLVNAVLALGPQRANAELTELAQLNAAMPGFLSLVGPAIITPSLQRIPAQYHQAFVNGLFSVSPAAERYAIIVVSQVMGVGHSMGGMDTGNSTGAIDTGGLTDRDWLHAQERMMWDRKRVFDQRPN